MLSSFARAAVARPRLVLLAALAFVVLSAVFGGGAADRLRAGQGTENPAAPSARAADVLEEHFPSSRPNFVLLAHGAHGVNDRRAAREGLLLADRLAYEDSVSGVVSYWQTGSDALKSKDGKDALIIAHLDGDEAAVGRAAHRLAQSYRGEHGPLTVRAGGTGEVLNTVERTIAEDLVTSELIALPLTLAILVLVFRSAVSALLPLAVGAVAITGTNLVLWVIAGYTDVSVFAQSLTTALGLGLAIDYALLMLRRFRDERAAGADVPTAVATMLRTAGRTVAFSALTVSVALAALLLFPLFFLRSFAYAGVSVVLLAAAAALVVLPALLVVLGPRVDALDVTRPLRRLLPAGGGHTFWARLTTTVSGRAPLFAAGSLLLLVALGLPFLGARFGMADDRQLPATAEPRTVQQTVRDRFDGSETAAIDVLVSGADLRHVAGYARQVSALPDVAEVRTPAGVFSQGRRTEPRTPVDALRESGSRAWVQVVPVDGVETVSPRSQELVRAIRRIDSQVDAEPAGQAAELVDTQEAIGDRLPAALALIVVTTLLLVFLLTGSVLVPVQAVLLNALSLTAMFGSVVWVFQDGHLSGLLGFTPTGFVDTALPVLMFCLAFGLSMDYGVFLLARMKEEYDRGGDHLRAVQLGVRRTGGIVTAAALILSVVLVSIGYSRITNTMVLGLGVALAVLVDATVVRCLLVPSVMTLTGRATWWAPAPLRRFQRRFGIREESGPRPADAPGPLGSQEVRHAAAR
ncbi:MMPL family transporter [Streptomyces sp. VRA16 Mangrove soil]|uniref:MMPL family transporter n=1 Tax=Streptomyces sp. VRA16 Mangrove soil TaxID=2817434 RepID=UPI001A9D548A|nr:MMPL family transporter [Streptomyces sp. VRA16 Mangrove soil]MBO1334261.1 MMPL family transporter [Streptomyces sp. VRA16 Mangrove soil]